MFISFFQFDWGSPGPGSLGLSPRNFPLSPFEFHPQVQWDDFLHNVNISPVAQLQHQIIDLVSPPHQIEVIDLASPTPPTSPTSSTNHQQPQHPPVGECPICFEDFTPTNFNQLTCGHTICSDCLRGHCERGDRITNECYAVGCHQVISIPTMQQIFSPPSFDSYQQQLTTSSLRQFHGMKLCGNGRCGYGEVHEDWKLETSEGKECPQCHHSCMLCGVSHDSGTSCADATNEMQRDINEVLAEVIAEEGRGLSECPCCHEVFAHNGGCVHMTCSRCNFEFCFRCNKRGDTVPLVDAEWRFRRCPCQLQRQNIFMEDDEWLRGPVNLNFDS
jgi:IBR domain, a half RING-finger domain/RING-type zinc-finger